MYHHIYSYPKPLEAGSIIIAAAVVIITYSVEHKTETWRHK